MVRSGPRRRTGPARRSPRFLRPSRFRSEAGVVDKHIHVAGILREACDIGWCAQVRGDEPAPPAVRLDFFDRRASDLKPALLTSTSTSPASFARRAISDGALRSAETNRPRPPFASISSTVALPI